MLTEKECDRVRAVNRRNGYCLTPVIMQSLFHRHEAARKKGDRHAMELIEYRLTDINFHYECSLLSQGRYDKLDEVLKNW